MLRVFLDLNPISYLTEWPDSFRTKWPGVDPAALLEHLVQAKERGLIRLESSLEVFEEASRTVSTEGDFFRRMTDLAFTLVGRWWLHALRERYVIEVRHPHRRFAKDDVYLSYTLRRKLRRARERKTLLVNVADEVRERAAAYETDARQARDEVRVEMRTKLGGDRSMVRNAMSAWWDTPGRIDEWCQDILSVANSRGLVRAKQRQTVRPKALAPSLWHYMAYRLLRIALEVGEGRSPGTSDEYDARHYSASATYADVLLTEDGRFRENCERLGCSTLEVMGLIELDARITELMAGATSC